MSSHLPGLLTALLLAPALLAGQATPSEVASERAAYVQWLETAANSPLAAVAQQPVGRGLRLGPDDSDVPLPGVAEQHVTERGGVVRLESAERNLVLPRGRLLQVGGYTLATSGPAGRAVLTVFADSLERKPAEHFPYDPALAFEGTLAPPEPPGRVRVLAVDGLAAEAVEAGTVAVPIGGQRVRLRVRRIPSGAEESELEIFFRDATNGEGTYPAGRFVSLVPLGSGRYRLDFNRARNPFCAYSTAYPCPAPWGGNTIPVPIRAGERYSGGGLAIPPGPGPDDAPGPAGVEATTQGRRSGAAER